MHCCVISTSRRKGKLEIPMKCQLCGYEFDEQQLSCHSSCALNKHCAIICCPNCSYQVVDESKSGLVAAFKKTLEHIPVKLFHKGTCPLSEMKPGESGTVVAIETSSDTRLERLSLLGVAPGVHIQLQQRRPTYVLRVGFTELSIEKEIAREILVQLKPS
jgi:Fe2+ transport system protein FeoA